MSLRKKLWRALRGDDTSEQGHDLDELGAELALARRRQAELEAQVAKLDKRLGMAMGAVQAATAQLMSVRQTADEALAEAKQAQQRATSAQSAAEAAADAVAEL